MAAKVRPHNAIFYYVELNGLLDAVLIKHQLMAFSTTLPKQFNERTNRHVSRLIRVMFF
jgi:hypothetical protein